MEKKDSAEPRAERLLARLVAEPALRDDRPGAAPEKGEREKRPLPDARGAPSGPRLVDRHGRIGEEVDRRGVEDDGEGETGVHRDFPVVSGRMARRTEGAGALARRPEP